MGPLLIGALLFGSLLATQVLLHSLKGKRLRRIEDKSRQLCMCHHDPKLVPITLITGFLGSGKTTLVNRILSGDHGLRIVIIENELGAISIDHALVDTQRQAHMPAAVVVLKNGCMWCASATYMTACRTMSNATSPPAVPAHPTFCVHRPRVVARASLQAPSLSACWTSCWR